MADLKFRIESEADLKGFEQTFAAQQRQLAEVEGLNAKTESTQAFKLKRIDEEKAKLEELARTYEKVYLRQERPTAEQTRIYEQTRQELPQPKVTFSDRQLQESLPVQGPIAPLPVTTERGAVTGSVMMSPTPDMSAAAVATVNISDSAEEARAKIAELTGEVQQLKVEAAKPAAIELTTDEAAGALEDLNDTLRRQIQLLEKRKEREEQSGGASDATVKALAEKKSAYDRNAESIENYKLKVLEVKEAEEAAVSEKYLKAQGEQIELDLEAAKAAEELAQAERDLGEAKAARDLAAEGLVKANLTEDFNEQQQAELDLLGATESLTVQTELLAEAQNKAKASADVATAYRQQTAATRGLERATQDAEKSVHYMTGQSRMLHAALAPIAHQIPGMTEAITFLHHGLHNLGRASRSAMIGMGAMAGVLVAGTVIKSYLHHLKELRKELEEIGKAAGKPSHWLSEQRLLLDKATLSLIDYQEKLSRAGEVQDLVRVKSEALSRAVERQAEAEKASIASVRAVAEARLKAREEAGKVIKEQAVKIRLDLDDAAFLSQIDADVRKAEALLKVKKEREIPAYEAKEKELRAARPELITDAKKAQMAAAQNESDIKMFESRIQELRPLREKQMPYKEAAQETERLRTAAETFQVPLTELKDGKLVEKSIVQLITDVGAASEAMARVTGSMQAGPDFSKLLKFADVEEKMAENTRLLAEYRERSLGLQMKSAETESALKISEQELVDTTRALTEKRLALIGEEEGVAANRAAAEEQKKTLSQQRLAPKLESVGEILTAAGKVKREVRPGEVGTPEQSQAVKEAVKLLLELGLSASQATLVLNSLGKAGDAEREALVNRMKEWQSMLGRGGFEKFMADKGIKSEKVAAPLYKIEMDRLERNLRMITDKLGLPLGTLKTQTAALTDIGRLPATATTATKAIPKAEPAPVTNTVRPEGFTFGKPVVSPVQAVPQAAPAGVQPQQVPKLDFNPARLDASFSQLIEQIDGMANAFTAGMSRATAEARDARALAQRALDQNRTNQGRP